MLDDPSLPFLSGEKEMVDLWSIWDLKSCSKMFKKWWPQHTKSFRYPKWRNPEPYGRLFWGWVFHGFPYSLCEDSSYSSILGRYLSEMFGESGHIRVLRCVDRILGGSVHRSLNGSVGTTKNSIQYVRHTLPETNSLPLKIGHHQRKLVFQPSIFRCKLAVSFREGICLWHIYSWTKFTQMCRSIIS